MTTKRPKTASTPIESFKQIHLPMEQPMPPVHYLICLNAEQSKRIAAVNEVRRQQQDLMEKKNMQHRIVSIDRPYLRPIVRGKENKCVEFGAKINNIQIDGISFIDYHSFEAFNEGIRLTEFIDYQ